MFRLNINFGKVKDGVESSFVKQKLKKNSIEQPVLGFSKPYGRDNQ